MALALWEKCLSYLQDELPSQQFNTWIRPLKAEANEQLIELIAPNRFVKDWVKDKYLNRIQELVNEANGGPGYVVDLAIGQQKANFQMKRPASQVQTSQQPIERRQTAPARSTVTTQSSMNANAVSPAPAPRAVEMAQGPEPISEQVELIPEEDFGISRNDHIQAARVSRNAQVAPQIMGAGLNRPRNNGNREVQVEGGIQHQSFLNPNFTFDSFVEGKSNQLAHAAAKQVAQNAGGSYNPLFIYGGVGLGKTHIMHAVGNHLLQQNPNAKILYVHSERFVQDMVKALQLNALNEFKRFYRSLDALLIDDIQFFANKEKSQEEFFHTFNALLEGGQQMILTCDRYPKEIIGLEERLKSRFGWGLTVAVEPPELETRVAILMKKAEQMQVELPQDAAFFVAQKIRSNVRELEGALRRVIAAAQFYGTAISLPLIKDALKDLLALQDKQISIENIQRTVADYYKIKVADLLSKRRTRSVARPRQVAMALSKELTNHSLPEIGDAFGGRDHTTVLHACRKIKELKETSADIREDYSNLLRTLTT